MIGIYKITEIATGLCYIGQSIHCHAQKRNRKLGTADGRWLQHHKRFPPALFTYEVLIQCPEESLNFFEKSFISGYDSHRNGFNGTIGGTSIRSTHPSVETRAKIGAANKGNTHNRGKTLSPEHREKISATHTGKTLSPEHCEKLRAANKGKTQSPEAIAARVEGYSRAKAARMAALEETNV